MSPTLSVIVLNYKTPDLSLACLQSLLPALKAGDIANIFVVDNASADGSAERFDAYIETNAPSGNIKVIRSDYNGGFSAGNNLGLRQAASSHILLLNSDTQVLPGSIKHLHTALADTPHCGLIGAQLVGEDGALQNAHFNFISPISEFLSVAAVGLLDRLLHNWCVAKPLNEAPEEDAYVRADWVSFAAVVIARPVIERIGLMDEGYFLYFEDVDYCQRARSAGWQVCQASNVKIIHSRGGSGPVKASQAHRKRLPQYYYESRTRYFKQHYGGCFGLIFTNLLLYAGYCIALTTKVYKKRSVQRVAGEWRDIWTGIFRKL